MVADPIPFPSWGVRKQCEEQAESQRSYDRTQSQRLKQEISSTNIKREWGMSEASQLL